MDNTSWIQNSRKRIFFDMHLPDWPEKGVASNFNVDEIIKRFVNCGADSVVLYAKCQYGNFYYDTAIGHKHRGLRRLDLFGSLSERLIQNQIKVIAYYSIAWDQCIGTTNPEWQVESYKGTKGNPIYRWKTICINSPYRQLVFDHLTELIRNYQFDGLWLDMTIVGTGRCFCKYCRKKYRHETGEEVPAPDSENFSKYLQWQYDYIEAFYEEARALCKSLKPNLVVCNNYWGYPYSAEGMSGRAIGSLRSADYVTGEAYSDWTGLNAQSFFSKFLWGVSGGRPYEVLIGRFLNTWDFTYKSEVQMEFETAAVIANGGAVTIDDEPFYDGSIDVDLYERTIKHIFAQADKRKVYFHAQPIKYAAIYYSQRTKELRRESDNSFIVDIAGSYKLLRDLHLPFNFIFDEELPELSDYSVLVLPNVEVIQEHILRKMIDYIQKGGVVISFGNFGQGAMLERSTTESNIISETFGIRSTGISRYSISYSIFHKRPCLIEGNYVRYTTDSGWEGFSKIIDPICETTSEEFYHNHLPSPYLPTKEHAVLVKNFGDGKLIIFPQRLPAQYARKTESEIIDTVGEYISTYVGKPSIRFKCPRRVDVSVMQTDDEYVIHLINPNPGLSVCCGPMETFEGTYRRTFEYMDEVIPVQEVKIELDGKYDQVFTIDKPKNVSIERRDDKTIFTVKSLNVWETVIIPKR